MDGQWRVFAAVTLAALFAILALSEVGHLQSGYSISIRFGPGAATTTHVIFPLWRKLTPVLTSTLLAAALFLWAARRRGATMTAWIVCVIVVGVWIDDVAEYGTIMAPTSPLTVLLLGGTAIAATVWGPNRPARRTAQTFE